MSSGKGNVVSQDAGRDDSPSAEKTKHVSAQISKMAMKTPRPSVACSSHDDSVSEFEDDADPDWDDETKGSSSDNDGEMHDQAQSNGSSSDDDGDAARDKHGTATKGIKVTKSLKRKRGHKMGRVHDASKKKKKTQSCPICHKEFFNLKRHVKHHSNIDNQWEECYSVEKKVYICHICQKEISRLCNFDKHVKVHNRGHSKTHEKKEAHECHICQRVTTTLAHLKRHLETHYRHNKKKKTPNTQWTCYICARVLSETDCDQHLKGHEIDERNQTANGGYKCFNCFKCYDALIKLARHRRCYCPLSSGGDKEEYHNIEVEDGTQQNNDREQAKSSSATTSSHKVSKQKSKGKGPKRNASVRCPKCSLVFGSFQNLKIHNTAIHVNKGVGVYKCKICGKGFGHPHQLAHHTKLHGDGTKAYKCKHCHLMYGSENARRHHEKHAHLVTVCEFCGNTFRGKYGNKHKLLCSMNPNRQTKKSKCEYCGKMIFHMRQHQGKHCHKMPHKQPKSNEETSNDANSHDGNVDNVSLVDEEQSHQAQSSDDASSSDNETTEDVGLALVKSQHLRHRAMNAFPSIPKYECYECKKCSVTFESRENYITHKTTCESASKEETNKRRTTMANSMAGKFFYCDTCQELFYDDLTLFIHEGEHKTVFCKDCNENVPDEETLQIHVLLECPERFKLFKSTSLKKENESGEDISNGAALLNNRSNTEKLFTCKICQRMTNRKPSLKEHEEGHRKDEQRQCETSKYKCSKCFKCYLYQQHLTWHVKYYCSNSNNSGGSGCGKQEMYMGKEVTTSDKEEKTYQQVVNCKICNRKIVADKQKIMLKSHESGHTKDEQKQCQTGKYQCPHCLKCYRVKRHRGTHIKFFCSSLTNGGEDSNSIVNCKICNRKMANQKQLISHKMRHRMDKQRQHEKGKYKCPHCLECYLSKQHQRTHTQHYCCQSKEVYNGGANPVDEHDENNQLDELLESNKKQSDIAEKKYSKMQEGKMQDVERGVQDGSGDFVCFTCQATFEDEEHLRVHEMVHVVQVMPYDTTKYRKPNVTKLIHDSENIADTQFEEMKYDDLERATMAGAEDGIKIKPISQDIEGFVEIKIPRSREETDDVIEQESSRSRSTHTCNRCSEEFASAEALKEHLKRVTLTKSKYPHTCPICPVNSKAKPVLQSECHYLQHKKEFKFLCRFCGKHFGFSKDLRNHIKLHHDYQDKKVCNGCHQLFGAQKYMQHVEYNRKEVARLNLKCLSCGKVFDSVAALDLHAEKRFYKKCDICGQHFPSIDRLKQHRMRLHKVSTENNPGPPSYWCKHCKKVFDKASQLSAHVKSVLEEESPESLLCSWEYQYSTCFHCGMIFARDCDYQLHKLIWGYQCDMCHEHFASTVTLAQHRQKHIRLQLVGTEISTVPQFLKCKYCGHNFDTVSEKKKHEKHAQKRLIGTFPFRCQDCDEMLATQCQVDIHRRRHIKEKRVIASCRFCRYELTRVDSHSKTINEECLKCGVQIFNSCQKTMHRLLKHVEEDKKRKETGKLSCRITTSRSVEKFTCVYCGKEFKTKLNKMYHENRGKGRCSLCQEDDLAACQVAQHREHVENKIKGEICAYCLETIASSGYKNHQKDQKIAYRCGCGVKIEAACQKKLHDATHQFVCKKCGRHFLTYLDLINHLVKFNIANEGRITNTAAAALMDKPRWHDIQKEGQLVSICLYCGDEATTPEDKLEHQSIFKYECPQCKKHFSTPLVAIQHFRGMKHDVVSNSKIKQKTTTTTKPRGGPTYMKGIITKQEDDTTGTHENATKQTGDPTDTYAITDDHTYCMVSAARQSYNPVGTEDKDSDEQNDDHRETKAKTSKTLGDATVTAETKKSGSDDAIFKFYLEQSLCNDPRYKDVIISTSRAKSTKEYEIGLELYSILSIRSRGLHKTDGLSAVAAPNTTNVEPQKEVCKTAQETSRRQYVCMHCKQEFKRSNMYTTHNKENDTEGLMYICVECGKSFDRNCTLEKHLEHMCKHCAQHFSTVEAKENHEQQCSYDKRKEEEKGHEDLVMCQSNQEEKRRGGVPDLTCDFCLEMKELHQNQSPYNNLICYKRDGDESLKWVTCVCFHCNKALPTKCHINYHLVKHSFQCKTRPSCGKHFSTQKLLRKHRCFWCQHCKELNFQSNAALKHHMQKWHQKRYRKVAVTPSLQQNQPPLDNQEADGVVGDINATQPNIDFGGDLVKVELPDQSLDNPDTDDMVDDITASLPNIDFEGTSVKIELPSPRQQTTPKNQGVVEAMDQTDHTVARGNHDLSKLSSHIKSFTQNVELGHKQDSLSLEEHPGQNKKAVKRRKLTTSDTSNVGQDVDSTLANLSQLNSISTKPKNKMLHLRKYGQGHTDDGMNPTLPAFIGTNTSQSPPISKHVLHPSGEKSSIEVKKGGYTYRYTLIPKKSASTNTKKVNAAPSGSGTTRPPPSLSGSVPSAALRQSLIPTEMKHKSLIQQGLKLWNNVKESITSSVAPNLMMLPQTPVPRRKASASEASLSQVNTSIPVTDGSHPFVQIPVAETKEVNSTGTSGEMQPSAAQASWVIPPPSTGNIGPTVKSERVTAFDSSAMLRPVHLTKLPYTPEGLISSVTPKRDEPSQWQGQQASVSLATLSRLIASKSATGSPPLVNTNRVTSTPPAVAKKVDPALLEENTTVFVPINTIGKSSSSLPLATQDRHSSELDSNFEPQFDVVPGGLIGLSDVMFSSETTSLTSTCLAGKKTSDHYVECVTVNNENFLTFNHPANYVGLHTSYEHLEGGKLELFVSVVPTGQRSKGSKIGQALVLKIGKYVVHGITQRANTDGKYLYTVKVAL